MKKYRAVLIDIDGTLLDFEKAECHGVQAVMKLYGVVPDHNKVARYREINQNFWRRYEKGEITRAQISEGRYPMFFGEMGVTVDPEECERLYRQHVDSLIILIDGAKELCHYLAGKYLLYAATNGYSKSQRERLRQAELYDYFQDIFVSQDTGSQKPQKEFFDYCFARMPGDISREEMIMIGDGLTSDIEGGIRAGIHTCWFNQSGKKNETGIQPDFEVKTLEEIKKIL